LNLRHDSSPTDNILFPKGIDLSFGSSAKLCKPSPAPLMMIMLLFLQWLAAPPILGSNGYSNETSTASHRALAGYGGGMVGEACSFDNPSATQWKQVAGKGPSYYPAKTDQEFSEYFDQSPNKIIQRKCLTCRESHQRIFYHCLTEVPGPENLMLMSSNTKRS
jgi:hypothetical protein